MPRTPTLMSSARLLVVRRAFLVLDARWTMAKKTFSRLLPPSFSLSLFLSLSLCLPLSLFYFASSLVLPASFLVRATPQWSFTTLLSVGFRDDTRSQRSRMKKE